MGKARGKAETAYRTAVCVGVFGVRRGSDEGAAVVDCMKRVQGVEIAQVLRTWKGAGLKGVV